MANRPKRPYRRAYLNDFQMDASGNYVYTGKCYAFLGTDGERKRYLLKASLLEVAAVFAAIFPECLSPVELSKNAFYLVPWLLQLVFVLLAGWSLLRLAFHASELRAYVYEATVQKLPRRSLTAAILSAVAFCFAIGTLLFTKSFQNLFALWARLVAPLVSAISSFVLYRVAKSGKWEEKT